MRGTSLRKNPGQDLLRNLDQSLGPARLLGLERRHLDRQLGGTLYVLQIKKFPSLQLGAIREVGVFGESVVLPTASLVNGHATPHAGSAVEVEEHAATSAAGVLQHEVAVEQDGLDLGQERVVRLMCVQRVCTMPILGSVKWWMHFSRKSGGGTKSASKIATNSPFAVFKPSSSAPALNPCSIVAMQITDWMSERGVALYQRAGHVDGFVGGVVEQLDVEFFARIVDLADRVQQAVHDVLLVEDRQAAR